MTRYPDAPSARRLVRKDRLDVLRPAADAGPSSPARREGAIWPPGRVLPVEAAGALD
jgi:hypothetical protein